MVGIRTEDEGVAGVALGVTVDRADVDEEDVVVSEHDPGLGPLHEVLRRVRAATHDDVVPAPPHADLLERGSSHGPGVLLHHSRMHLVGDQVHGT